MLSRNRNASGLVLAVAWLAGLALAVAGKPPHVVFMLVDDLGWDDVSYHGSSQIPTPAIDYLAMRGARLDSYYVQPVCSPTRATLLTGRHVIHTGVYDPMNGGSGDLSLNFTLLPQHLQTLGYQTHMVGKWHLGLSSRRFTPLSRGFQTYMGYLGGAEDYWLHGDRDALDFFDGAMPEFNFTCWDGNLCPMEKYSANIFAARASKVIANAAKGDKPMFLYLAWQSVHSGDGHGPTLQAPQSYIDSFNATVSEPNRKILAGMIKSLDEGVRNVTEALKEAGIFNDTLIIFSTDNGGPADYFDGNMASNAGQVLQGKVHVSDFLPSLLTMAARESDGFGEGASWLDVVQATARASGNEEPPFVHGDGIDVWDYLSGVNGTSPRSWVLHEAHKQDSTDGNGNALRVGDYKIVARTGKSWASDTRVGSNDGWFGGFGSSDAKTDGYSLPTGQRTQPWTVMCPPPPQSIADGYACEKKIGAGADAPEYTCLFNIADDPCEHKDLSKQMPEKLTEMLAVLDTFRATSVVSTSATANPDGSKCPHTITVPSCGTAGSQSPMSCQAAVPCPNP